MYIMTPVLKTSRRLLNCNIVRYTFPKTAVDDHAKILNPNEPSKSFNS